MRHYITTLLLLLTLGVASAANVGKLAENGITLTNTIQMASSVLGLAGNASAIKKFHAPRSAVHKNSLAYEGETHVYRVKNPDGTTYKIGESAQGTRVRDGTSIRAEQQVRKLNREVGPGHSSEIRKTFPNKAEARAYETKLIERFRRMFGQDKLPGNKTNR